MADDEGEVSREIQILLTTFLMVVFCEKQERVFNMSVSRLWSQSVNDSINNFQLEHSIHEPYEMTASTLSAFEAALLGQTDDLSQWVSKLKQSSHLLNGCDNRGISILFILTASRQGIELLLNDVMLCNKITAEGLNRIVQIGPFKGRSPIYNMAKADSFYNNWDYIDLFTKRKDIICDKITPTGMSTIIKEGPLANTSAAYWFCKYSTLLNFIGDRTYHLISAEALNTIEPVSGKSPFHYLASYASDFVLNPALYFKITADTLNALDNHGLSSVYYLACMNKGKFVQVLSDLQEKITSQGINSFISFECQSQNLSAVYWLVENEAGRMFLLNNAKIRSLISKENIREACRRQAFIDNLVTTETGKKILAVDPEFMEKCELPPKVIRKLIQDPVFKRYATAVYDKHGQILSSKISTYQVPLSNNSFFALNEKSIETKKHHFKDGIKKVFGR